MNALTKQKEELQKIAATLAESGKGILAADEPLEYMKTVLNDIGLENSEENRRRYREVLFTSDKSLGKYLSGVILHPETVYQKTKEGILFVRLLKEKGILPGVNVDKGLVPLYGTNNETTTQGLDNLARRCEEFKNSGCWFAKWRCALKIGSNTPSSLAVSENATVLARYASICQANGLVPIVEPEVQLEGDHDLQRAEEVTEIVLTAVYKALKDYNVFIEGTLLKPSMVLPGRSCSIKYQPENIARATVNALLRSVPAAVPGIGFLSGGQTADEATENLLCINSYAGKKPWALTFIFGRALQSFVPNIWKGKEENITSAQSELIKRAKANSNASLGCKD
ncbi:hypothetical protein ILUMI_23385 [Ignelater luminosus]|uniref:Fructose-bisphosphate aldolase n=1 Tax=Ignelater luminosus TaxID=2038154 RepID=A0A8K0CE55_IGNLU|nr:hypothetical protein ILUMI_23385 [Ignelater luminosus]